MIGIITSLISFAIAVKDNPNVDIKDVLPETNTETGFINSKKESNIDFMI